MSTPGPVLLRTRGLGKRYGTAQVLRGVDLEIRVGEVIGIVGPNGAGKSTLIKLLDGVVAATEGTVELGSGATGRGELRRAVGVVHQDLGLVEALTVAENLSLAAPEGGPWLLGRGRERAAARELLAEIGLDPGLAGRPLGVLSLGERTLLAAARTLATGARIVVMDEATSALPPREAQWLVGKLRERAAAGSAVLMVSHKLVELTDAVDRCVVVVDGRVVADVRGELLRGDAAAERLVELMSPGTTGPLRPDADRSVGPAGEPVLRLDGAVGPSVGPVDLQVAAGEVVGLTGRVGSGLYDVAFLAAGRSGTRRGGRHLRPGTTIGFLPPDRVSQGNVADESVAFNLTLSSLRRWQRGGVLGLGREASDARSLLRDLAVVPPDPRMRQGRLSGGNQQKVLIGRLLLTDPQLLVLAEPTRGVDVRTRRHIYRIIDEQRNAGVAVLVVTTDLDDLLAVCDRVGVVESGRCGTPEPVSSFADHVLARFA